MTLQELQTSLALHELFVSGDTKVVLFDTNLGITLDLKLLMHDTNGDSDKLILFTDGTPA